MPVRKFKVGEEGKLAAYLDAGLEKAAMRALYATALRLVQRIVTVLIPREPRPPVDRGAFRAAWRARKEADGASVYNSMPYAAAIEGGVRAENVKIGKAMIDALTKWVLRKGLVKVGAPPAKGGKAAARRVANAEARQVAWAIAMAMKKRGIFKPESNGLRLLDNAMLQAPKFFEEELQREIARAFKG